MRELPMDNTCIQCPSCGCTITIPTLKDITPRKATEVEREFLEELAELVGEEAK